MKTSAPLSVSCPAAAGPLPRSTSPAYPLFLSEADLEAKRASPDFHILGVIRFGLGAPPDASLGFPQFSLPMAPLETAGIAEVWASPDPVVYGEFDRLRFAANEHILFGALCLREREHATLESATYRAYRSVLELLRDRSYPYPLRMWNYFPGINEELLGLERYQRFCLGRYQAFAEHRYTFDGDLPAASAIGIQGDGLWVYFLAAREPGAQIENPRQISAYRYPPRYGPRSPSFSRATLTDFAGERQLYLSGTASIVGHETRHRDNAAAQLRETLANIRAILDHPAANARLGLKHLDESARLKVYIRNPADFESVSDMLAETLGAECPILYLQGDICRHDLMLEIEGIIRLPC